MVEVSRRRFLAETSLGLGVGFASVAAFRAATVAPPAPAMRQNALAGDALQGASLPGIALLEPMVVHVRDVATAEIAVLVGTQEFIYRDPELVARLVQTAQQVANTEG
jgi:hypothetical protein